MLSFPAPSAIETGDGTMILTSASTPFNDPPPNGYLYCLPTFGLPCTEYPFYYDPRTTGSPISLDTHETSNTLTFSDSPSNPCLFGGQDCNGMHAPAGSPEVFLTQLVGILPNGQPATLPVSWLWTDSFNGTNGGIGMTLSTSLVDLDSGTGGITITSGTGITVTPEPSPMLFTAGVLAIMIALRRRLRRF
jgi:hypothetical protein